MSTSVPAAPMAVRILECKRIGKGAVVAALTVKLGKALIIRDVMLLSSHGRSWASLPGKLMIGSDGVALLDEKGKRRFTPVLEWEDRDSRDRWSASVIQAFEERHGPIAAMSAGGAP